MNNVSNVAFVFVVCGSKEHITTLNFSLQALKKFTQHEIIVVTDSQRNESEIQHHQIIDVHTPAHYTHHQASIWLKTSLHRILPANKLYAYLDSDVIALNNNCNRIFEFYRPPITFAKDHTSIQYFSPYALNCKCYDNFLDDKNHLETALRRALKHSNYPGQYSNRHYRELLKYLHELTYNKLSLLKLVISIPLSFLFPFHLKKNIVLDSKHKRWIINKQFDYPVLLLYRKKIKKEGYVFSFKQQNWFSIAGNHFVKKNRCNHLIQAIQETFFIGVANNFQHWNGGVFLFDHNSHAFLEQWHQNTLTIFSNPYWKIRDQATLIVTAHQFGLQNHITLPEEFNFIADFYKPYIYPHSQKVNSFFKSNKIISPSFIHIYHHFGDKEWDVWQRIEQILGITT